jgi:hypothetical protein
LERLDGPGFIEEIIKAIREGRYPFQPVPDTRRWSSSGLLRKVLFLEWNGGIFGIGADGPDGHKFLDPVKTALFHHLDAHDQILVKKRSWVGPIRPNPSDGCGQMDDNIRPGIVVPPFDGFLDQAGFSKSVMGA